MFVESLVRYEQKQERGQAIERLRPGRVYLVTGPRDKTEELMQELTVQLAVLGPLMCLVGGNRFAVDDISLSLYGRTDNLYAVLETIYLSRAFTCYQMVEMLRKTPAGATPILVMDLLTTFSDESVDDAEANRLLRECNRELKRLSKSAPVVVSAHPQPNRERLLEDLIIYADENFVLHAESAPSPTQKLLL